MAVSARIFALVASLTTTASAAPPAALASALEYLREQKSYSWEVINADPGPVAQNFETRRGTVTTVQRNTSPNLKGQIDRNGDMLIQREWSDGSRLETFIAADSTMITLTPEGWMTDREILTAQAEERLRSEAQNPRATWLRRADRPSIRRPDQELVPFLQAKEQFEVNGDSYVIRLSRRGESAAGANEETGEPSTNVTLTINLRGGLVRDYEVKIETTQRSSRARIAIPVSEQRIVVLTYVPVTRIDLPDDARRKLVQARTTTQGKRAR
jgi:hypothetical protein